MVTVCLLQHITVLIDQDRFSACFTTDNEVYALINHNIKTTPAYSQRA